MSDKVKMFCIQGFLILIFLSRVPGVLGRGSAATDVRVRRRGRRSSAGRRVRPAAGGLGRAAAQHAGQPAAAGR